jgi:deoxyribonuclease V
VEVTVAHEWPLDEAQAVGIQEELRPLIRLEPPSRPPETIAGLDVAYAQDRVAGAVVVLDAATLDVVAQSVAVGTADFPYISGLFAFRELPTLVEALRGLTVTPDLLVCDGYGLAHPRRFGLACHLGVLTGLPTIGVGKTAFVGDYEPPGPERGAATPLRLDGEVVGRVLRTQPDVKPVFVSVGHRMDLDSACRQVLAAAPRYRLPETTRQADHLARAALARS